MENPKDFGKTLGFVVALIEKVKNELQANIDVVSRMAGPKGDRGQTGERGERGPKGEKGDTGLNGIAGPRGERGEIGPKGEKGERGETGPTGDRGETGLQGIQGIQGEKGEKGDVGPQGDVGPVGTTGSLGPEGKQGIQGPEGQRGAKGEKGDRGEQGVRGEKGDIGARGEKGEKGDKGDTGEAGPQGIKGPKGDKGKQGKQGKQGPQGEKGDTGETPDVDLEPIKKELQKTYDKFSTQINKDFQKFKGTVISTSSGGGSVRILDNDDVEFKRVHQVDGNAILIFDSTKQKFVSESLESVLQRLRIDLEIQYDRLVDTDGDYTYIGEATPGSARDAAAWRIKRVYEIGDDIEIVWADNTADFEKVWDNRATYEYN